MHFQTLLTLLAAAASTTLAAPTGSAAPVEAVSNELSARGATPPPWTIENFKRTCGGGTCHYTYCESRLRLTVRTNSD